MNKGKPGVTFTKTSKLFLIVLIQFIFVSDGFAQATKKKLFPWYIYKAESSFSEIEPYKDMIHSISVFGNPTKSFIDRCHANNIQVYHAVGGTEREVSTLEKIDTTINRFVDECLKNNYDGIDLDLEALDPKVQSMYTVFLKKLSTNLHQKGKKLSHCVGFYPSFYEGGENKYFYKPDVIAKTCDLVRVMCYDLYFAPGKNVDNLLNREDCQGIGPVSTYHWTKDAMNFWTKYVSREKLVMALPAYSNDYVFSTKITGSQVYKAIPDIAIKSLATPNWLWYERLHVYTYNDEAGNKHLFYASDDKSTKELLKMGDELKLSNIGFWHLSSIDAQTWNVINAWIK